MGMALNMGQTGDCVNRVPPTQLAWQLTPIGITVGRRFPGFTEVTVGKDVMGVKFGVGYRF